MHRVFSIAGATVTLSNLGNGQRRRLTPQVLAGGFQFTHLNAGYTIELKSPIQDSKTPSSTASSSMRPRNIPVPPVVLELGGAVSETITVEADANHGPKPAGAEITDTVEREQIEELPILDRDPLNLLELQAGVSQDRRGDGAFVTVINGQRQSFSNLTLDGINIQDNYVRSWSLLTIHPNLLFMSQVGEFTTTTQNAGPQAGMGSSQVSMVTPSGTNQWHGEGFWDYRTDALAANDWFDDAEGIGKPNLLLNQGGGDIGGPVIKDKLFVYGAYELFRLRQQSRVSTTVLTPMARNGIFQWQDLASGSTPVCATRRHFECDSSLLRLLRSYDRVGCLPLTLTSPLCCLACPQASMIKPSGMD